MADDLRRTIPRTPASDTPPDGGSRQAGGSAPAEPLKGEVSRTDAPGAGASPRPWRAAAEPPAPKPANPAAADGDDQRDELGDADEVEQPAPAAAPPAAAPTAAEPAPAARSRPRRGARNPRRRSGASTRRAKAAASAESAARRPDRPSRRRRPTSRCRRSSRRCRRAMPDSVSAGQLLRRRLDDHRPGVDSCCDVLRHLRDAPDAAFDFCSDVTATDWPPRTEARFDVVYCLYSTRTRHRVRVKVARRRARSRCRR